jgi:predicted lipoprotein
MRRARAGTWRRRTLTSCAGLALALACGRTDEPHEHYSNATVTAGAGGGVTPPATAGSNNGSGASPASSQAGSNSKPSNGGSAAGDADSLAGAGPEAGAGGDGPVITPPEDDCGDPPVSTEAFTRRALREQAADCAIWQYCRFASSANVLSSELDGYASAPSPATLDSARVAYQRAMELWSEVELFQFGPLASNQLTAGRDVAQGQGIRELIYSWPLVARQRVEEQVVNRNYESGWQSVFVTARGLFALDYLLFYAGSDTQCAPSSVCGKNWKALDADELTSRKQAYAAAVGDDIVASVKRLEDAWSPDAGNFRPVLVDATGYMDEPEAMKIISWSLLYVEREVKDWKLGIPSGHTVNAPVSSAETPYSGLGTPAIVANLRGFQRLFQGCGEGGAGLGFDDWLIEAGHPELASDIAQALSNALAAAEAFPPFQNATPAELEALYQTVKALTNLLKNDLFGSGSPIGLGLPPGIQGDTD